MPIVLLLSGPVAVGKSTVTAKLVADSGFKTIRSGEYLREISASRGLVGDRLDLQQIGDSLDERTDFNWLVEDVAIPTVNANPNQELWMIDSVRKSRQVEHFRRHFGRSVYHVHLTASETVLQQRFEARRARGGEYRQATSYDDVVAHPNERAARALLKISDLTLDMGALSPDAAVAEIKKMYGGESHAASGAN